jgi:hypothetical protein
VKRPMDLGTVLKKLKSRPCGYGTAKDFEKETKLTFSNCIQVRSIKLGICRPIPASFDSLYGTSPAS